MDKPKSRKIGLTTLADVNFIRKAMHDKPPLVLTEQEQLLYIDENTFEKVDPASICKDDDFGTVEIVDKK